MNAGTALFWIKIDHAREILLTPVSQPALTFAGVCINTRVSTDS